MDMSFKAVTLEAKWLELWGSSTPAAKVLLLCLLLIPRI